VPLQRSPLAWPLLYQWPVHRLGAEDAPTEPPAEPTGLLVRREADGEVRFAALSPLAVYLLSSIGEQPGLEGQAYLQRWPPRTGWPRTRWPDPVPRCCGSSCRPA
jgi:hypothetical protein